VGDVVTVGITAYAEHQLGELQYVGLPRVGAGVVKDQSFGEVESTKTVSDLYAPCSGTVVAVNSELIADPALVNRDPYGAGWIVQVAPLHLQELKELLDQAAYDDFVATQEH
jgi:glycine cleavage system H protein